MLVRLQHVVGASARVVVRPFWARTCGNGDGKRREAARLDPGGGEDGEFWGVIDGVLALILL